MEIPKDYKYSKEHTWLQLLNDNRALVGITEFAQSELGEIVYVDLSSIGKQFKKDEVFGSVEALKTTSDLYMPVSGEITEVNTALKDNVTLINSDPFTEGWLTKIKLSDANEIETLLNAGSYNDLVK